MTVINPAVRMMTSPVIAQNIQVGRLIVDLVFRALPPDCCCVCMTQVPSFAGVIPDPIINLQKDEEFRCQSIPLPGLGWLTKNAIEPWLVPVCTGNSLAQLHNWL